MLNEFYKYQGAGNDFVIIDNRTGKYSALTNTQIEKLCDRHFGIGADGLMFLNKSSEYDFSMQYFNSDGNESTMCGNGGRCIVRFANELGIIKHTTTFEAVDGIHEATLLHNGTISLKMIDVETVELKEEGYLLNTGSIHLVIFTKDIQNIDVISEARKIRYSEKYINEGINVNFVEIIDGEIYSRTYERGVEFETLACGTGAVAIAIAFNLKNSLTQQQKYIINAKGGKLEVRFKTDDNKSFKDVFLTGHAVRVFIGKIEL